MVNNKLCHTCDKGIRGLCPGKEFSEKYCLYQHIPNFVSGVDSEIFQFNTLEDLYDTDFIKHYANLDSFAKLSVSKDYNPKWYFLMLELKDGSWWVLGYIHFRDVFDLDLDEWKYAP